MFKINSLGSFNLKKCSVSPRRFNNIMKEKSMRLLRAHLDVNLDTSESECLEIPEEIEL